MTMVAVEVNVKIIPFCIPLPSSSSFRSPDHVDTSSSPSSTEETGFGIVGTITLRGRSAVVWFGWGEIEAVGGGGEEQCGIAVKLANDILSVGNGAPPMGSFALSMPPVIRNGRPSLDAASTTQLLGGSSEEDMILGHHISARLAKRIGCPIFVSCSLSGWGGDSVGSIAVGGGGGGGQGAAPEMSSPALSAGYDDSLQQHAAALAEREVSRILMREIQDINLIT